MISVVVPIYNVRDFLPQCLDSLYAQEDISMEVILVNDGSTDGSFEICKEYAEKYSNTIIIDKRNGGLSDARNEGTKVVSGNFVYYLDSDDWLAPYAIRTLYCFAIENNCEVVQGGFYYAYDDHLLYDSSRKQSQILERGEAMLELIKNDYVKNFAWGKLYRSDIVKKHLFPVGKFYEDSYWQHWIIHEVKNYGIIPTPLYYYRQRSSGISGSFSLRNLDLLRGYEDRLSFVNNLYPEFSKQMVSTLWNLSYSMMTIANKSEDVTIKETYRQYWEELNKRHSTLFEEMMCFNLQYMITKFCPRLIPVYHFCVRAYDRLIADNIYSVKPIDERL